MGGFGGCERVIADSHIKLVKEGSAVIRPEGKAATQPVEVGAATISSEPSVLHICVFLALFGHIVVIRHFNDPVFLDVCGVVI